MSSTGSLPSLLTPIGYQSGDCGYCKADNSSQRTPDSRASYYVRSKALSPEHYQELMDRGWRRSGALLYLPDGARSCCPHYTIRLPVSDFKPSRDQRQALNRWNRYVLGEDYIQKASKRFPKTKEEKKRENVFDLSSSVHQTDMTNLKQGIEPDHRLEVALEPDKYSDEKFELFDNYQRHVHKETDEDISKSGFKRFLCSSPIARRVDNQGKQLGSYHQCYRLDGRLIAMAVLDLLPHAVSGVYFIYHSDFEKWSFGKLSALQEACLTLEKGYQFYYMGYYIHSCRKMRYKGDYKPQYVLDLNNHEWQPLNDELRALMDMGTYASTSKEREQKALLEQGDAGAENEPSTGQMPNRALIEAMDEVLFPAPLAAMNANMSLIQLGMPGVLTLDQLKQDVDLNGMSVYLGRGGIHNIQDISSWHTGTELNMRTLKGTFAEFAATVGPVIAREAIVDFS